MKARIENNLLIITLVNESEISQVSDFHKANNYKTRNHELSIRFDIDLRSIEDIAKHIDNHDDLLMFRRLNELSEKIASVSYKLEKILNDNK